MLLGDADQLPSVDAGAVFRDLAPLAVRLTRSHRLDPERPRGRQVLELAAAIRAGKRDAARLMTAREQAAALDFGGAELLPAAAREDLLERWYTDRVAALPDFAARTDHVFTLGASPDGGFSRRGRRAAGRAVRPPPGRTACWPSPAAGPPAPRP